MVSGVLLDYSKERIAEVLLSLLDSWTLTIKEKRVTLAALETMAAQNMDFTDALTAGISNSCQCGGVQQIGRGRTY